MFAWMTPLKRISRFLTGFKNQPGFLREFISEMTIFVVGNVVGCWMIWEGIQNLRGRGNVEQFQGSFVGSFFQFIEEGFSWLKGENRIVLAPEPAHLPTVTLIQINTVIQEYDRVRREQDRIRREQHAIRQRTTNVRCTLNSVGIILRYMDKETRAVERELLALYLTRARQQYTRSASVFGKANLRRSQRHRCLISSKSQ